MASRLHVRMMNRKRGMWEFWTRLAPGRCATLRGIFRWVAIQARLRMGSRPTQQSNTLNSFIYQSAVCDLDSRNKCVISFGATRYHYTGKCAGLFCRCAEKLELIISCRSFGHELGSAPISHPDEGPFHTGMSPW